MNEFCDEQQKQAIVIAKSLQTLLSFLLPAIDRKKDGWKELYDHIVCPAIQVSTSMQLSSANYWITSRMPKPPDQSTAVFVNEIQKCEMVDITSHKIIRPDSVLKIAEDGRIGEQMLVVQPALLRGQKDSGSSIILCKPTVLVRLDEPMGRKNRGIKALTSWLAGDVGE